MQLVDDKRRLDALRRYRVLDTPPEEGLDRLVRLAARMLETPVAALCFVDAQRVFCKSAAGCAREELDPQLSFSRTYFDAPGPVCLPDILLHPQLAADAPQIGGKPIRSLAGAPLRTRDGLSLGLLVVADHRYRDLSAEQLLTLGDFAEMAMDELSLRKASERAQEHLRTSVEQLRAIIEASPLAIYTVDDEGCVTSWNRACERIFGWTADEALGQYLPFVQPEKREEYEQLRNGAMRDRPFSGQLLERVRKDQSPVLLNVATAPLFDASARAVGVMGIAEDVTLRQRALAALERTQQSYRNLLAHVPFPVLVHRAGHILYANGAAASTLGFASPVPMEGTPVVDLVHGEERASFADSVKEALEGKPPKSVELRMLHARGRTIYMEATSIPISFDEEVAVLTLAIDVTERRELTAKMMQMDRLVAVGTLAAGVAHEINNPLAFVTANLEFLSDALVGDRLELSGTPLREVQQVLGETREGTERVRSIVRDLKTFSRSSTDEERVGPVDVRKVIDSSIQMARNELRHRARLSTEYGDVPAAHGNEARLGQVIINLLVNAAHAIEEGNAERNEIRVRTFVEGDDICIEVSDTGRGIALEHLPRIFDPFFTTKPVGQGTGLGLSICAGIVRSLGGEIAVASELGRGSAFTVRLPRARTGTGEHRRVQPPRALERRARLLLVDDEPLIRSALRRLLGREFDTEVAGSGREVLDALASGKRYDLIVCDLMMPEMTGMELHEELSKLDPAQAKRMVFLTGGAFTPAAREFVERGQHMAFEKPLVLEQFRVQVAAMLGMGAGQRADASERA